MPSHAGASSALLFLVARSARNRLRVQLARLKNVRYVLGMIFLIAYFTFIVRPDRIFGVSRMTTIRRTEAGSPAKALW